MAEDRRIQCHFENQRAITPILRKLPVLYHIMFILTISSMKFHPLLTKKSLKCRSSKGNNSSITDYILVKPHHAIYFQYRFHEIQSIYYKVMAEDGKNHQFLYGNNRKISE